MPSTARVAVPLPLDQLFTYRIPSSLAAEAKVGSRVLVPFGPRTLTGMLVEQDPATDEQTPDTLKAVIDVLDREPVFSAEMLRLTRWISRYYICTWGEVIKAALPSGIEQTGQRRVYPADQTPAKADGLANQVAAYLQKAGPATVSKLQENVSSSVTTALVHQLEEKGLVRVKLEVQAPDVTKKKRLHVRLEEQYRGKAAVAELTEELPGHKQVAVVETLFSYGQEGDPEPRQTDLMAAAEASHATLKSLERRGVIQRFEKEVLRTPLGDLPAAPEDPPDHTLMPAQETALQAVHDALDKERAETFLLHGVTGSGKTEVYIRALRRAIEQGKSGIVLVPEIALTPQTVNRFRAHFGDQIGVLHSRMNSGERYDTWRQVREGVYPIVIGPRSAVLAPVENLGLIIVDEEHESSYKQFDPAPRYHARDVAVMRAYMNDAVCILGSATPSLESYLNAKYDKYTLLRLSERVPLPDGGQAALPEVQVVDLTLERRKHQLEGALSQPLREAIEKRLERKEQIILLQNRRGYAPVVECKDCGWTPECSDCAVSMTYHKAKRQLRCHYCGLARRLPATCLDCQEDALDYLGQGTQRIEEELEEVFPQASVQRMDRDTTSRKHSHRRILERFSRGTIDVLLGTQMIAKGLDFERVTLVGVVNADTGMLFPDFRSGERTFQLLTQVAGRAGRSELAGEVILQTRNPEHRAIKFARKHDYKGFVQDELPERQQFQYPPYGRLVGVEFRGSKERAVKQLATKWTGMLRLRAEGAQVMGPEEAFVHRVKRQYRYHTLLRVSRKIAVSQVQQWIRGVQQAYGRLPSKCRIAVDVDPIGRF